MKRLLLILLLFSSQFMFAQESRINLRIGGGRAFSQGNFKKATSAPSSGFAENGLIGKFGLGYPINNVLQLDFDVSFANYQVDEMAFNTVFIGILESQAPGSSKNSSVTIGSYTNSNVFASLRFNIERKRAKLYFKPGLGLSWLKVPSVISFVQIGSNSVSTTTSYKTDVNLIANLSTGLELELSDDVSLDLNCQYLISEYESEVSIYSTDQNGDNRYSSTSDSPDFASLNLTISVVFFINPNKKKD